MRLRAAPRCRDRVDVDVDVDEDTEAEEERFVDATEDGGCE